MLVSSYNTDVRECILGLVGRPGSIKRRVRHPSFFMEVYEVVKKDLHAIEIIKETVILTVAVAIIAAAVYFPSAEPYVGKQHFGSGHCAVQLCTAAAVGHHDDPECGAAAHRFCDVRQRIWRENGVYKYHAAVVPGAF